MSGQLRYSARLVLNVAEIDGRWHGGHSDIEVLSRKAMDRRRPGEIAILVDQETKESWRLELEGDQIRRAPL